MKRYGCKTTQIVVCCHTIARLAVPLEFLKYPIEPIVIYTKLFFLFLNHTHFSYAAVVYTHQKTGKTYSERYNLKNITRGEVMIYRIPETCCRRQSCSNIESVYKVGCLDKVEFIVSQSALLLGIGAMSVACIQVKFYKNKIVY